MIRNPTLFVLGAGASKPYGLPLGLELRTLICRADGENHPAVRAITQNRFFTLADIQNVTRPFLHSGVKSIDEFLGRHPHLVPAGKVLIAAILCARENPEEILAEGKEDHWYRLLWSALTDDTMRGQDLRQNNVRFITFNYDRSLEYFLHESTKGTYGGNDATAFGYWAPLRPLHLYGSLGEFNLADGAGRNGMRPYNTNLSRLDAAADGINIMPEGRDDAPVFKKAQEWFDWAERVFVLGFGFDRLNCDRLGCWRVLSDKREAGKPPPTIIASVFKLKPAEATRSQQRLMGEGGSWTPYDADNTTTLRLAGFPD